MSEDSIAGGGDGGAGGGCLHCSLITSSMSSSDSEREREEATDWFPVTAFLLPGLYLLVLSVRSEWRPLIGPDQSRYWALIGRTFLC